MLLQLLYQCSSLSGESAILAIGHGSCQRTFGCGGDCCLSCGILNGGPPQRQWWIGWPPWTPPRCDYVCDCRGCLWRRRARCAAVREAPQALGAPNLGAPAGGQSRAPQSTHGVPSPSSPCSSSSPSSPPSRRGPRCHAALPVAVTIGISHINEKGAGRNGSTALV